jgi:antitoxin VapB
MGINIKNPEAERLIRELAEKTGKGQTEAVTIAVREALERVDEAAKSREIYDKLLAIAAETGPLLKGLDMDEALYGENGLYDRETGLPK